MIKMKEIWKMEFRKKKYFLLFKIRIIIYEVEIN